ncbi:phospholipid/cholesterol/gamma-HCH transport system substrate-binding protein [Tamaricihabitans halophyticus]|uniref:Phospholipid/cholesterol/gamma-HCH transport system substrate-binding protein n=1 Tax=Tamaricihabitans halophyticus TaxID=1262583 RepID=A0A4R2R165_9PSEU|nr:MCE family protein [Tamaricihabitans halophyticus]TCP53191.1 phospholipid/cholesterol/gamma-HCH transport system substrate-binding protein [Tamaricihabitans halophyticus]
MLTRRTKLQVVAFFMIAVVSVTYALFRFTDISKVFGESGYTATLELAQSGGIFSNAEVTYRGVNVGRVGELRLTADGLEADLNLDPDTPKIPTDLQAVVANRSAIGEQYVDLRPNTNSGPYLENGSQIDVRRTSTPVGTDEVVANLDGLTTSIPTDALRTVVDESYEAFRGTGGDLQVLLDTARDFTATAKENLPQTVNLLETGNTVLNTQRAQAGNITSFSEDLRLLSEQLKSSDGDIRELISVTPQVSNEVSAVLRDSGENLGVVLANLLTTSKILSTRTDGLEMSFIVYPMAGAAAQSLIDEDGKAHLGFALNLLDPPTCMVGYEGTNRRPGNDLSEAPTNSQAYCAEPKGSPINVRGSANAPYGGRPDAPTQAEIEASSDRPTEAAAEQAGRGVPGARAESTTLTSMSDLLGLPG